MKIVNVLFAGFLLDVSLELRSEPGAFVALAWLPDERHNEMNEFDIEQWEAFHDATNEAFCDLGSRTAWIPAHAIIWIREA